jgi:NhaA family Na+:H+ antiporter
MDRPSGGGASRTPALPRLIRPLQEFLSTETAGGVLLLAAAAAALIWANAPLGNSYRDFWQAHVALELRVVSLDLPLVKWVNDGLMAVFFFVVGLEIKREVLRGELADARRAALPVAAALGGMIVPALIYVAFNAGGDGAHGWGIPMATDIAFAVGVLVLLGRRIPLSLKVFLLALAIVDDLGAIAVIAVFYTDDISPGWLAAAAGVFALVFVLGRMRVRALWVYVAAGAVAWLAVHESGVHATIAGVAMGLLTPVGGEIGQREPEAPARDSGPVLERLEHLLHPWASYAIIPIFALANAGVSLGGGALRDAASAPVSLGVAAGLVLGKPLGITLASLLAVRSGLATLPRGVSWPQIVGVSMVGGIGFTVSLFISDLAFTATPLADQAKIGILAGSALMGAAGFLVLRRVSAASAASNGE